MSDNPKLLLVTLGAKIRELMRRHEELKERAEAMEMHIAEQSEEISALRGIRGDEYQIPEPENGKRTCIWR